MATSKSIALITGANRGIGFTLARTLARDHSFLVLLGSRSVESGASAVKKLQAEGLSVEPITIDLSDDSSISAAAKTVQEKYGRLDVLVNNAGIAIDQKFEGGKRELFQETFNTNVFGTAVVTDAFLPLLSNSELPRIVFLSSEMGSITERVNPKGDLAGMDLVAYRASKAAVNMIAAQYHHQYNEQGWKVNTVCPGYVATDMNAMAGVLTTEEAMPNLVRLCTLGKDGESGTFTSPHGPVGW